MGTVEEHRNDGSTSGYLVPPKEYKRAILDLFPQIPPEPLDNYSMLAVDALFLGYFLEKLPQKVSVVEIGSFVGASAFCFASHPNVAEVSCIDPNLPIADELTANSDLWKGRVDFGRLGDLKPFDVARGAFRRFRPQREKVRFLEGVAGTTEVGTKLGDVPGLKRVEIPAPSQEGAMLLVYLDALHTRAAVRADLSAIFASKEDAVVLLDDCRRAWGPFVQAGVVDFMERAEGAHRFRLAADLNPSLGESNLGVLYPEPRAEEMGKVLAGVAGTFGKQLGLSHLLKREEELTEAANGAKQKARRARENARVLRGKVARLKKRESKLEGRVSRLEGRNARLVARSQSRRYKLADAVAENLLRLPAVRGLLRRGDPDHE